MTTSTRKWILLGVAAVAIAGVALPMACSDSKPAMAQAYRVESREQLVGGRRALAEVGDFKISNGIVQAIVQDVGHSRGFGAFGGSLIDLDVVRAGRANAATGVWGNDQFTELFPAFFLEAMEPSKVEVAADGSDGGPAIIRVTGDGNQFLSLAKGINSLILNNAKLSYQVDYVLEPGKQYVKAVATVKNDGKVPISFGVDVPTGFITLLGAGQKLFVPGKAGYDMRFRLEEVYSQPAGINALPGEVAQMFVTEGKGTSYAFFADPAGATYLQGKKEFYPTAQRDSMLIPLAYSSFLGTYWGRLPQTLNPGKSYSYTGYLAVGGDDIASAQKVVYDQKEQKVARISGRVRELGTGAELKDVSVVLQDDRGHYVSSARTRDSGVYVAWVPPGKYRAIAVSRTRSPAYSALETKDYVEVPESGVNLDLEVERPALLSVRAVDEQGRAVPAKVSVEGTHEAAKEGALPWQFLYSLRIGEAKLSTDFIPDGPDQGTRKFLETHFFINHGRGGAELKPGRYTVHVSRGIEYDVAKQEVELLPGKETQINVVLNHVMPTPDYISGDFHVHSEHSVDSDMAIDQRVLSYAAEGVDYLSSTDHNYVSDFAPMVTNLGLNDWLSTTVGIELTTLEMGHFNAWPLKYAPGPVTHGSFNWFRRKPADLFANLRSLGTHGPDQTIIQVNHPRDTIMGYFNGFNLDAYSVDPRPPKGFLALDQEAQPGEDSSPYAPQNFSFDFDVIEVFNGKRLDLVHNYRIPEVPPPGKEPSSGTFIPKPGEILEQNVPTVAGADCPDFPAVAKDCVPNPVYPGVLDDYYSLLGHGKIFTAVGNSDSHGPDAEAGLPRTYLRVGESANLGSMRAFDELHGVEALKNQRAIVTNGPFVELFVNDQPIGSRLHLPKGEAKVNVRIKVQAAPWVDVTTVQVMRGGRGIKVATPIRTFGVCTASEEVACVKATDEVLRFEHSFEVTDMPDESFLTVEVAGERSMWPVYTPNEIPSIAIGEAVGAIGSAFGVSDKWGRYRPEETQVVKPFAFTNPVFVDHKSGQALSAPLRRTALPLGPDAGKHKPRVITDLTKLLSGFHGE